MTRHRRPLARSGAEDDAAAGRTAATLPDPAFPRRASPATVNPASAACPRALLTGHR